MKNLERQYKPEVDDFEVTEGYIEDKPYPINISDIDIKFVRNLNREDGLIGFASCVLNRQYYIANIAIFSKEGGKYYVLGYPKKEVLQSRLQYHRPFSRAMAIGMKTAILNKAKEELVIERKKRSSQMRNV